MQYSTITLLAATFASMCSGAPTAASTLPSKFGLTFVALEGTALASLASDIIYDPSGGFHLYLAAPGQADTKVPAIFTSSGSSALISRQFLALKNQPSGSAVFLSSAGDAAEGGYTTAGLGCAGGALTWDFSDGKGAQAKWTACETQGVWGLNWGLASQPGRNCYGVKLVVTPV